MAESSNRSVQIELIALSVSDGLLAQQVGASRLELCSAIECGGLTPSIGFVTQIVKNVNLPCRAMIRCRAGDFIFTQEEVETMWQDGVALLDAGATGLVVGAINQDGKIDLHHLDGFLHFASGKPLTFHRVFDLIEDWKSAFDVLIERKVDAVLTGGGTRFAAEGKERLKEMMDYSNGRIEILAGGGVRAENVKELIRDSGVTAVHAGPFATVDFPLQQQSENIGLGTPYRALDLDSARSLVSAVRGEK